MKGKKKTFEVSVNQLFVLLVVTALGVGLFYWFHKALQDGMDWKQKSEWAMVEPDFESTDMDTAKTIDDFTLTDRFKNKISLSQFKSADILIINLWSSDCPPCAKEIPSLAEMDRHLGELGKVALLTITVDEKWDDVAGHFPFGTDLRVLFDPDKKVVEGIFGTEQYPETFILDKNRKVRARFDGIRQWHTPQMFEYIKSFI